MKQEEYNFIRSIRDEAIQRLYVTMRRTGDYACLSDICEHIAEMPMPLHYISYRMARQAFNNHFHRGRQATRMWPQKRRMYDSFIQRCRELATPGRDEREVIMEALLSPAPCVGLSPSMIRRILVRHGAR